MNLATESLLGRRPGRPRPRRKARDSSTIPSAIPALSLVRIPSAPSEAGAEPHHHRHAHSPRVRSRTQHILAVENITARERGARISSNQVKRLSVETVDQMPVPEDVALAVKANVAVIHTLSVQIDLLEKRLQKAVRGTEYDLVTTIPGIGRILATTILLETGSIDRFASPGNFASYARCVDSQHTSNGKKKGEGNTKNGNKYLSWAFIEAAHFAMRYCVEAKRFYERKKSRTNNVVAIKALAHKLARACFHILKERKPFDVTRCFA
jgi:transposase